jgi:hypothetical protein
MSVGMLHLFLLLTLMIDGPRTLISDKFYTKIRGLYLLVDGGSFVVASWGSMGDKLVRPHSKWKSLMIIIITRRVEL